MENKVQLKEEELVGDSVVLSDIYPKTDTESVTDVASGESMDVLINRLWEAINNKLTRVVNSVNNRTGAVVLDASDVGLSNVDNVSFGEIKQWMLDQLEAEFFGHGIKFFNSLNEVETQVIGPQDKAYVNTPFFAYRGNVNELDDSVDNTLAYIGFFKLDGAGRITYENSYKTIRVVGKTDKSLVYDPNEDSPTAGLLKVNIHPDEKVLYLDEGTNPSDQGGLRIDETHLGGKTYVFYGAYWIESDWSHVKWDELNSPKYKPDGWYPLTIGSNYTYASGLLLSKKDMIPQEYDRKVRIYINNHDYGLHVLQPYYDKEWRFDGSTVFGKKIVKLNDGDCIICFFKEYTLEDNDSIDVEDFDPNLMGHQTSIGNIRYFDSSVNGANMEIRFQSLEQRVTWGLTNKGTFSFDSGPYNDSELSIKNAEFSNTVSVSPINALSEKMQFDYSDTVQSYTSDKAPISPYEDLNWVVTPTGINEIVTDNNHRGGMFLNTDYSLAIMPCAYYGDQNTFHNWKAVSPNPHYGDTVTHPGFLNRPTYLGINLLHGMSKETDGSDDTYYIPMSGLITVSEKLNNPSQTRPTSEMAISDNWTAFGLDSEDPRDTERIDAIAQAATEYDYENLELSGGLMVNVGEFLEIFSDNPFDSPISDFDKFITQGKVNVRVGDGLKNDGHNRITLDIAEDGGIEIDPEDGKIYCSVGSASLNAFKLDDMEGHSFFYNPSAKSSSGPPKNCTYLHLGPGLVIGTDELPEPEVATYVMLGEEPDGWSQTYTSYYVKNGNTYTHVTGEEAPEFVQGRYYYKSTMVVTISFPFLTSKPDDWDDNWTNYYEKDESSGKIVPIVSDTAPEFVANKYYYKKYEASIPDESNS